MPPSDAPSAFSAGLRSALRGLSVAGASREVRSTYARLVAAIFVVAVSVDAGGLWAVWHYTGADPDTGWAWLVVLWMVRIAGSLIVLLVAPLLALFVVNTCFGFLGERVFFAALREVSPHRAAELQARAGLSLATGVGIDLARMALFFGFTLLTVVVSLVPVVGAIAGPSLSLYFTARLLGWELLDPYLDKLQLDFAAQRRFVAEHRAAMVGFGLPVGLLMAIPLVGPLLFGLTQASAAVFVADVLEGPRAGD